MRTPTNTSKKPPEQTNILALSGNIREPGFFLLIVQLAGFKVAWLLCSKVDWKSMSQLWIQQPLFGHLCKKCANSCGSTPLTFKFVQHRIFPPNAPTLPAAATHTDHTKTFHFGPTLWTRGKMALFAAFFFVNFVSHHPTPTQPICT